MIEIYLFIVFPFVAGGFVWGVIKDLLDIEVNP